MSHYELRRDVAKALGIKEEYIGFRSLPPGSPYKGQMGVVDLRGFGGMPMYGFGANEEEACNHALSRGTKEILAWVVIFKTDSDYKKAVKALYFDDKEKSITLPSERAIAMSTKLPWFNVDSLIRRSKSAVENILLR
jgi:hypothetical protein